MDSTRTYKNQNEDEDSSKDLINWGKQQILD